MALDFDLFTKNVAENAKKLKQDFESIIDKYNQPFDDCDEIDLRTFTVVRDKGELKSKKYTAKSFGRLKLASSLANETTLIDPDLGTNLTLSLLPQTTLKEPSTHQEFPIRNEDLQEDDKPDMSTLQVFQECFLCSEPSDAETISSESSLSDGDLSDDDDTQDTENKFPATKSDEESCTDLSQPVQLLKNTSQPVQTLKDTNQPAMLLQEKESSDCISDIEKLCEGSESTLFAEPHMQPIPELLQNQQANITPSFFHCKSKESKDNRECSPDKSICNDFQRLNVASPLAALIKKMKSTPFKNPKQQHDCKNQFESKSDLKVLSSISEEEPEIIFVSERIPDNIVLRENVIKIKQEKAESMNYGLEQKIRQNVIKIKQEKAETMNYGLEQKNEKVHQIVKSRPEVNNVIKKSTKYNSLTSENNKIINMSPAFKESSKCLRTHGTKTTTTQNTQDNGYQERNNINTYTEKGYYICIQPEDIDGNNNSPVKHAVNKSNVTMEFRTNITSQEQIMHENYCRSTANTDNNFSSLTPHHLASDESMWFADNEDGESYSSDGYESKDSVSHACKSSKNSTYQISGKVLENINADDSKNKETSYQKCTVTNQESGKVQTKSKNIKCNSSDGYESKDSDVNTSKSSENSTYQITKNVSENSYVDDSKNKETSDQKGTVNNQESSKLQPKSKDVKNLFAVGHTSKTTRRISLKTVLSDGKSPSTLISKMTLNSPCGNKIDINRKSETPRTVFPQCAFSPYAALQARMKLSSPVVNKIHQDCTETFDSTKKQKRDNILQAFKNPFDSVVTKKSPPRNKHSRKKLSFPKKGPLVCSTPLKSMLTSSSIENLNISTVSTISPVSEIIPNKIIADVQRLGNVDNVSIASNLKPCSQTMNGKNYKDILSCEPVLHGKVTNLCNNEADHQILISSLSRKLNVKKNCETRSEKSSSLKAFKEKKVLLKQTQKVKKNMSNVTFTKGYSYKEYMEKLNKDKTQHLKCNQIEGKAAILTDSIEKGPRGDLYDFSESDSPEDNTFANYLCTEQNVFGKHVKGASFKHQVSGGKIRPRINNKSLKRPHLHLDEKQNPRKKRRKTKEISQSDDKASHKRGGTSDSQNESDTIVNDSIASINTTICLGSGKCQKTYCFSCS